MSARGTSRRRLLGASAAMLLVATPEAGEGKARELDGDLLDACRRFHAAHVQHDLLHVSGAISDDEAGDVVGAWLAAREAVAGMQPRTPEGLQAKAHVAFIVLREQARTGSWTQTPWRRQVTPSERMALECLAVIAGMAEA